VISLLLTSSSMRCRVSLMVFAPIGTVFNVRDYPSDSKPAFDRGLLVDVLAALTVLGVMSMGLHAPGAAILACQIWARLDLFQAALAQQSLHGLRLLPAVLE